MLVIIPRSLKDVKLPNRNRLHIQDSPEKHVYFIALEGHILQAFINVTLLVYIVI